MSTRKLNILLQTKYLGIPKIVEVIAEKNMSLEDVLDLIEVKENISKDDFCFCLQDATGRKSLLPLEQSALKEKTRLHLLTIPFSVQITHLGIQKNIRLKPSYKLSDLWRAFSAAADIEIQNSPPLCYNSEVLQDDDVVTELLPACLEQINNGKNGKTVELNGAVKIKVRDEREKSEVEIEVYEFETVEKMMKKFCEEAGRTFTTNSYLSVGEKEMENNDRICETYPPLRNGDCINFNAAPFRIIIIDGNKENEFDGNKIEINAEDHWDVNKLRKEYCDKDGAQTLMEDDNFYHDEMPLDDLSKKLSQLALRDGVILKIKRAQLEKANLYNCAECGKELKLKPLDAVQCKYCFFRIVYKKRTMKVCQYNCR